MTVIIDHLIIYGISIVVVIIIAGIAALVIGRGKQEQSGNPEKFRRIMWDRFGFPSLSLFQFFLWTGVIAFGFLSVYLIRISAGVFEAPIAVELPSNILVLMGISTIVPVARSGMLVEAPKSVNRTIEYKNFSWLLQDKHGKPTLAKFQMFAWTVISIIIYLAILFSSVNDLANANLDELDNKCQENRYLCLSFPDIDSSLLVLMGLSQGAYLGAEYFTIKNDKAKSSETE